MSLGQRIRDFRRDRRLSPSELGLPYEESMIRKIEQGSRRLAKDVAPILVEQLDSPSISLTAIREFTGIGPAWLDGDSVDLHRSSVRERCLVEMSESMDAIHRFATSMPPQMESDTQRKKRKEHLLEVMDSIVHEYMYVAVQCEEYGFSFKELHDIHYAKLRSLRLIQANEKASGGNQRL